MTDKEVVLETLALFEETQTRSGDALLAAYARKNGPRQTYSFDQRLSRLPGEIGKSH